MAFQKAQLVRRYFKGVIDRSRGCLDLNEFLATISKPEGDVVAWVFTNVPAEAPTLERGKRMKSLHSAGGLLYSSGRATA